MPHGVSQLGVLAARSRNEGKVWIGATGKRNVIWAGISGVNDLGSCIRTAPVVLLQLWPQWTPGETVTVALCTGYMNSAVLC